ncbi:MAG TPA: DoxX family protein [Thermoanaerobaculia bacterium]|nr:DoxX family protein [Thermoanaerobaculia bacterium]
MPDIRPRDDGWAVLPLRLMIGFGFAAHGWAKLSRGPDHFAVILSSIGVPRPQLMAWATSLLELVGGIAVMAGALVVPFSVPLIAIMLTAMFSVHFRYGFSSIRLKAAGPAGAEFGPIGYEMNLLYIVGLLTLVLAGPGRLSVDRWRKARRRRPHTSGATSALVAGTAGPHPAAGSKTA